MPSTPDLIAQYKAAQVAPPDALPPIPTNPLSGGVALQAVPRTPTPALGTSIAMPGSPLALGSPLLSPPTRPNITVNPLLATPQEQHKAKLNEMIADGSGVDQVQNPLLRGIARAADVVGSVFAPNLAQFIPGTTLHHQLLVGQQEHIVNQDDAQAEQEAQTANLNLQPAFKQQAAALAQEKQNNVEDHQKSVLDQTTQHQHDTYLANLNAHGFTEDLDKPGIVRPLRYEEMSGTQQAVEDLKGAQKEQAEATAALRAAQNDPSSPAYQIASQRLAVAKQNARTAQGRLGLSGQEFAFNQDKFYNPQPTAAERGKGDLAQSALERVQEMRQIIAKHPEYFGPVAGRATNAQQWLGSQDPDAQTYQSAAQYLADHSAGIFGGRGQYILSQLHSITDPHSNPAALNAALDEAERAAQGFVKAGTVHGKGSTSSYNGQSGNAPQQNAAPDGTRVQMPNGGFQVKRGGKWVAE